MREKDWQNWSRNNIKVFAKIVLEFLKQASLYYTKLSDTSFHTRYFSSSQSMNVVTSKFIIIISVTYIVLATPTGCVLEVCGLSSHIKCNELNSVCEDLVRLGARLQPADESGNIPIKNLDHLTVGNVQQILAIFDSDTLARRAYDNVATRNRYRLRAPTKPDLSRSTDNSTPNQPVAGHSS